MATGSYYDKDCRRGHVINWVKGHYSKQYWKCERCGKMFTKVK